MEIRPKLNRREIVCRNLAPEEMLPKTSGRTASLVGWNVTLGFASLQMTLDAVQFSQEVVIGEDQNDFAYGSAKHPNRPMVKLSMP